MDTGWKRFRDGTEEQNPSWSFFGSILGMDFAMIMLAMTYRRGSLIWEILTLWFLVFAVISWRNLGKSMKNEKKHLVSVCFLDRTFPDLVLLILLGILICNMDVGWNEYSREVERMFVHFWQPVVFLWQFFWIVITTGIVSFFIVILYMSLMRHIYREELRKKLFFCMAKDFLQDRVQRRRKKLEERQQVLLEKGEAAKFLRRRMLFILCGQNLVFLAAGLWIWGLWWDIEEAMVLLIFMGTVCFLLDLLLLLKISKEMGVLLDEIEHMAKDQKVQEEPALKPHSLLGRAEMSLLSIWEHKRESVEKQIQSERMKVELITNVSHDLKTPLTSMIGCIDLLKQAEDIPKEAQDYVNLLSSKAERLGGMIQDVFDMAKAASGHELQMERLDMARLLRQTAADMQDRMKASGLNYRMKIEDRELPFLGDSKKMYRVYQNLIENTLKYSMAGSRVYVEVSELDKKIRTTIKNTSDCEMDFSAEEIMERFMRGDKSRSTEGNGLGLSIARSFTEACGGSFQVTLDGDLFRVDTVFPMADE